jgi:branched-chain amino acid transport system substrate-binding protein
MRCDITLLFHRVILVICFIAGPALADTTRPVLIGFDGEYGLINSTSAQSIELGLKVAIEEINEGGGVLGGRPLQLVTLDNRSVPARGVANFKRFADMPDLVAVIGGRFSQVQLQQVAVAHELKLPLIDAWGAANGITDHAYLPSYTFRVSLKDDWAMPAMVEHASNKGKKRIGVLLPNTGWGRSNQRSLEKALEQRTDITLVGTIWYNFGEKQLLGRYRQLVNNGAEALLLVANDSEASALVRELGAQPDIPRLPIISHWGVTGGRMVEASGETLHELDFSMVQTFSFFNANPQAVQRFMRGARSMGGIENIEQLASPVGAGHGYDILHLLAAAIERAGNTNRDALRDALESGIHLDGIVRHYRPAFTADNHDALSPDMVFMARFRKDGVIVPIDAPVSQQ